MLRTESRSPAGSILGQVRWSRIARRIRPRAPQQQAPDRSASAHTGSVARSRCVTCGISRAGTQLDGARTSGRRMVRCRPAIKLRSTQPRYLPNVAPRRRRRSATNGQAIAANGTTTHSRTPRTSNTASDPTIELRRCPLVSITAAPLGASQSRRHREPDQVRCPHRTPGGTCRRSDAVTRPRIGCIRGTRGRHR